jgi:hypothetical protein
VSNPAGRKGKNKIFPPEQVLLWSLMWKDFTPEAQDNLRLERE